MSLASSHVDLTHEHAAVLLGSDVEAMRKADVEFVAISGAVIGKFGLRGGFLNGGASTWFILYQLKRNAIGVIEAGAVHRTLTVPNGLILVRSRSAVASNRPMRESSRNPARWRKNGSGVGALGKPKSAASTSTYGGTCC